MRHTRCSRDWSSDVCSSDLFAEPLLAPSMTFIRAQASALTEFTALYVSPQRASPSLPFPSDRAVLLRSEEHTSELQSRLHLVCRLLLEKKKHPNIDDYRTRQPCRVH